MFDNDYFQETQEAGPGTTGRVVGGAGMWLLHIGKVAFLVYSGYHGINATAAYRGHSELGAVAGIVGIVVTELVLFSLYLAWHNQRITGAAQSIAAGVTYAIGFIIACLAIVVDSQLNAGMTLSSWLASYLHWVLPVAPAVMALGALLVHELAADQLRGRKEAKEKNTFAEDQFKAHMASLRAEMETSKMIKNMQLNTRMATAKQIAQQYSSEGVQRAIAATAEQNIPALLRAIGIVVEDTDGDGDIDTADLIAQLTRRQRTGDEPIIIPPNGRGAANPTNGRGS